MTSPFPRFKYQGAAPGADTNNYELFNSTTWQTPSTSNLFSQLGIHKFFVDIQNVAAGTLKFYKSQDLGVTWVQVHQESVAASTTETVQREWLVETYSDFKAVWTNGGSAQTTFSVDMALVDERAGSGVTSGGSSGDASAANQTSGNQKTQVVDAGGTPLGGATAAGADAVANPTLGGLFSFLMGFGGTTWNRLRAGVTTVSSTLTGLLNTLPWAIYHATPTARTDGQGGPIESDASGNTQVNLATRIAGEDITNDILRVEQEFSYANQAGTTTGVGVKSGAGFLHALVINTPVASAVITLYDNTAASGTKIATITLPASLVSDGPIAVPYNVKFSTGLTLVIATGAADVTVAYR